MYTELTDLDPCGNDGSISQVTVIKPTTCFTAVKERVKSDYSCAKQYFWDYLLPLGVVFFQFLLPVLSIGVYTRKNLSKTSVQGAFGADIAHLGFALWGALEASETVQGPGFWPKVRAFKRVIDEKTGLRWANLFLTGLNVQSIGMDLMLNKKSEVFLHYDDNLKVDDIGIILAFFGKLVLLWGLQVWSNMKGMRYAVDVDEVGGHTPRVPDDCIIPACRIPENNERISRFQGMFDRIIASIFFTSITLLICMFPYVCFKQTIFKSYSNSNGYPISTSVSRAVQFPKTCENITHCAGKFYGLQRVKVLGKEELPKAAKSDEASNKVLFMDFLNDAHDSRVPYATLPLRYEMPEGTPLIGMFARVPETISSDFEVCVEPQTIENGPVIEYRKQLRTLDTLGRFTVGVRHANSSNCSIDILDQGTISFFNAILSSNYSMITHHDSRIKALTSLVQRSPGTPAFLENYRPHQHKFTFGPGNRITGIIQENLGVCPTCLTSSISRTWLMQFVLYLLIVTYGIVTIVIPFPRMAIHGMQLVKSFVSLPCFVCYIGYHGRRLYAARRTLNKRIRIESHLALQHSLLLLTLGLALLIIPVGLEVDNYYAQVSTFIQQIETVKFDVDTDGSSPNPPYFSINSLCNGVYPCGTGRYIARTFIIVLIISLFLLLGGNYLRAAIFCRQWGWKQG